MGSQVAIFQKTNVTKYKEYITLFQRAEKEFGGVDVKLSLFLAIIISYTVVVFFVNFITNINLSDRTS